MHPITDPKTTDRSFTLPPLGDNPSTQNQGTTPGSFAQKNAIGSPRTFSSPDTPGMPEVSNKTAWDFLPNGWTTISDPLAPGTPGERARVRGSSSSPQSSV